MADDNEFNGRMLTEIRDGIDRHFSAVVAALENLQRDNTKMRTEMLDLKDDLIVHVDQGVVTLRRDVALIHGYMAQAAQRFDGHEARLKRIEKHLALDTETE